jgi:ADP-ribose pyrophosphatase
MIPLDQDGMVWFVRQFRHPAGIELLELPAGTLDADETPAECAARELREEIGMAAESLIEIGSFFLAPGYSTEYMYVFLARELSPAPLAADEDEDLAPERIEAGRALEMVREGRFQDAKTIAALHLVRRYLTDLQV